MKMPRTATTRRLRARIREKLLPVLEHDFAPSIVAHLGELARLAGEQEGFFSAIVEDRFRSFVRDAGDPVTVDVCDLLLPLKLDLDQNIPSGRI